jgi:hypothetical protein
LKGKNEEKTSMRRKDKEISDSAEIESIIREATVCRLAMTDGSQPYIVPLCFGYQNNVLYFHSALKGKKLDILRQNERVCFEFDSNTQVRRDDKACEWGMLYSSVVGFGTAEFIEETERKRQALQIIVKQYAGKDDDDSLSDADVQNMVVFKVDIDSMTGKRSS